MHRHFAMHWARTHAPRCSLDVQLLCVSSSILCVGAGFLCGCASVLEYMCSHAHLLVFWARVCVWILQELHKRYKDGKLAVESLAFGVPVGQCFGFLVR